MVEIIEFVDTPCFLIKYPVDIPHPYGLAPMGYPGPIGAGAKGTHPLVAHGPLMPPTPLAPISFRRG